MSVVVRTYAGRQELLAEALASIVAQTFRPIEVVVVEDGSAECESTVQRTLDAAGISTVYRAAPKRGRCHTGSMGLELSSGQYVNFLDDDDRLYPEHLERLVALLKDNPGMPAAFGRSEVVRTTIRSLAPLDYDEEDRRPFRARAFTRWHLWYQNQFPIQSCLFRRELYERHGGFDDRYELLEDWELWARYLSNEGTVGFVDEITSMFRIPSGGSGGRRERDHDEHISAVVGQIRTIQVMVSAGEVREVARPLLDDMFTDSGWLSTLWRARGRNGMTRLLLGPVGPLVSGLNRLRARTPRSDAMTQGGGDLARAVERAQESVAYRVSVGEAQIVLRDHWRAVEPERYALLALRNAGRRLGPRLRRALARESPSPGHVAASP